MYMYICKRLVIIFSWLLKYFFVKSGTKNQIAVANFFLNFQLFKKFSEFFSCKAFQCPPQCLDFFAWYKKKLPHLSTEILYLIFKCSVLPLNQIRYLTPGLYL